MLDHLFDSLRVLHMLAFAAGIGVAIFLEAHILRRFARRITPEDLGLVLIGHRLVLAAVIALWATGLGLLALRLGPMGGEMSPKLAAKLSVVALLTVNMAVIDRMAIPLLQTAEGLALREIPALVRGVLGGILGLSAGCWLAALLIAGMRIARELPASDLVLVVVTLLATAVSTGAIAGVLAGALRGQAQDRSLAGAGGHLIRTP